MAVIINVFYLFRCHRLFKRKFKDTHGGTVPSIPLLFSSLSSSPLPFSPLLCLPSVLSHFLPVHFPPLELGSLYSSYGLGSAITHSLFHSGLRPTSFTNLFPYRLHSSPRTDSADFMTASFLLSISVFIRSLPGDDLVYWNSVASVRPSVHGRTSTKS